VQVLRGVTQLASLHVIFVKKSILGYYDEVILWEPYAKQELHNFTISPSMIGLRKRNIFQPGCYN
jgi:hypothetical protein